MKTKLLKKLRQQFIWRWDKDRRWWKFYDRKSGKEDIAVYPLGAPRNDQLLYILCDIIGYKGYIANRRRIESRQFKKKLDKTRREWEEWRKNNW